VSTSAEIKPHSEKIEIRLTLTAQTDAKAAKAHNDSKKSAESSKAVVIGS
jgi:hypothetical protein